MKLHIVGNGYYGKFLREILSPYANFAENAETIILAVPFSAYKEVAEKFRGKHLVNICSVQEKTNAICQKYSKNVTGFHPLFGPKSSEKNRRGILTLECPKSREILDLFQKIGTKIIRKINGKKIDGKLHDQMMAQSHATVIALNRFISEKVRLADWIPEEILPPSFIALREFSRQYMDMSAGTVSSIMANPYIEKIPFPLKSIEGFTLSEAEGRDFSWTDLVSLIPQSVKIKAEIVQKDSREKSGDRIKLNLGHTFAHAIESVSHYQIPHGQAVAIGLKIAAQFGETLGITDKKVVQEISAVVEKLFPRKNDWDWAELWTEMTNDKKRAGDKIQFIIPRKIGEVMIKEIAIADLPR